MSELEPHGMALPDRARPASIQTGQAQFLRFLIHELRNLAAPMRNAIHVLRLSGTGEKRNLPIVDLMERQLTSMEAMLDRISDAVRLSQGTTPLELADLSVADIVQQAAAKVQPMIAKRRQRLLIPTLNSSLWVRADASRLSSSLAALLDNASKFSPEESEISIEVRAVDRNLELRVRDAGAGITPDMLSGIFDFFPERAEDAHRRGAGLGLGLPMARLVAELHHGRISANSAGVGQGSEFVLSLPAATPNTAQVETDSGSRQPPAAMNESARSGRHRVLIADDSGPVRASLSSLLEELGHEVQCAQDGEEALRVAREWHPEFVLLDMNMPKLNGVEAARRLRAEFAPAVMQLVMMSGIDLEPAMLDSAKRAGFDFVIDKLGDLESLNRIFARGLPAASAASASGH